MKQTDDKDTIAAMRERAAESIAMRIKTLLADQWSPLVQAGWLDEDIRTILDHAVRQCDSEPK